MRAKLDHVGIAVRNIERSAVIFGQFGLQQTQVALAEGVRIGFLSDGSGQYELLEPLGPETVVARFLERRGEGLHHLCFEVGDLKTALTDLGRAGLELIDRAPRQGVDGQVAFIHPRSCGGVLVELIEKSR